MFRADLVRGEPPHTFLEQTLSLFTNARESASYVALADKRTDVVPVAESAITPKPSAEALFTLRVREWQAVCSDHYVRASNDVVRFASDCDERYDNTGAMGPAFD